MAAALSSLCDIGCKRHYLMALEIRPDYVVGVNLGMLYLDFGNCAVAAEQFQKALKVDPDRGCAVQNNLGATFMQLAQYPAAVGALPQGHRSRSADGPAVREPGLRARPPGPKCRGRARILCAFMAMHSDNPKVLGWLAWRSATAPDDAVRNGREVLYRRGAVELAGGDDPCFWMRWLPPTPSSAAIPRRCKRPARQLIPRNVRGQPALAEAIRGRARLFQAGRPLRDPPPHFPDNPRASDVQTGRKNHVPSVRQGGLVVPSSTIAAPPSQSARRLPVGKLLLLRKALADVVVCLLLVAAVFAVFGQTARFSFINFDDDEYVYENPHVLNGLTAVDAAWAFTHTDAGADRHPLTLIPLTLDAQIVNPAHRSPDLARLAAWMHFVNVVLHAANAVLLYLLLRRDDRHALASRRVRGGHFAVHPLHVESVAWITECKDVLSGLFGSTPSPPELCVVRPLAELGAVDVGRSHAGPRPDVQADAGDVAAGLYAAGLLAIEQEFSSFQSFQCSVFGQRKGDGGRREREIRPVSVSMLLLEKASLLPLVAAAAVITFLLQRSSGALPRSIPCRSLSRGSPGPPNFTLPISVKPCGRQILSRFTPGSRWNDIGPLWAQPRSSFRLPRAPCGSRGAAAPVPDGLVLVSGDAPADHRTGASRHPSYGRPLRVPSPNRAWHRIAWLLAYLAGQSVARRVPSPPPHRSSCSLSPSVPRQTSFWRDDVTLWQRTLNCTTGNYNAHLHLGLAFAAAENKTRR